MSSELRCHPLILIPVILLGLLIPRTTEAQIEGTGFIRNYNAVQTVPDHRLLVGRNRFRLDLGKNFSSGEINVSNEVQNFYIHDIDSVTLRLREAYADLYFDRSDLRIGKQIISWGRAEGAVIADILTPLDLTEFLTQEFADLRTGVVALSYTHYFGSDYLQLVVNPVFHPNRSPRPGDRWFPRSFFDAEFPVRFREYRREPDLGDVQLGLRLALRQNLQYDLDIGYLYWHYPNPGYRKDLAPLPSGGAAVLLQETHTRSHILFYSGTLRLTEGVLLTSESAFYTSRAFDFLLPELRDLDYENLSPAEQLVLTQAFAGNEDGFLMNRPWLVGMAGVQFDWGAWTIDAQWVDEYVINHDSRMLQDEHFGFATLRLQRSFLRDKLSFRGFARYHVNGGDVWVNPELTYSGIDNIEASAGTQLFGGPEPDRFYGHISFEQYAENSFAYFRFTAYF